MPIRLLLSAPPKQCGAGSGFSARTKKKRGKRMYCSNARQTAHNHSVIGNEDNEKGLTHPYHIRSVVAREPDTDYAERLRAEGLNIDNVKWEDLDTVSVDIPRLTWSEDHLTHPVLDALVQENSIAGYSYIKQYMTEARDDDGATEKIILRFHSGKELILDTLCSGVLENTSIIVSGSLTISKVGSDGITK
jgi:hypothetical protein